MHANRCDSKSVELKGFSKESFLRVKLKLVMSPFVSFVSVLLSATAAGAVAPIFVTDAIFGVIVAVAAVRNWSGL